VEFTTFNQQSSQFNDELSPLPHRDSPRRALNFAAPTADRSSTTEQGSPRVGAAFTPACSLIDCTFDDNIHFLADALQDNYVIGLDHIQLLNKYGMAAQQCK
ncbi:hypothetical protein ANCCAN_08522, partial [Ancylostoma caninum]